MNQKDTPTDSKIRIEILSFLRALYGLGFPLPLSDISGISAIDEDDLLANLNYLVEKKMIDRVSGNIEDHFIITPKGMDELEKQSIEQSIQQKTSKPKPTVVIKHYSSQLDEVVRIKDYHGVMAIIDGLYIFLKQISLQTAERYHLQNAMKHLSDMAHSLWVSEAMYDEKPEKKENDFKKYIQPPYQNVTSLLKSIIENPIELKYLERPIKEKKTFLSNFKNFLHNKKFLEVSNIKDPFYQKLIVEINKAYSNEMPFSMLLLLRKLFETIIADLLWKRYRESSLFREENGKSKGLSKILKNTVDKIREGNFTNDDKKFLENLEFVKLFRDYGNKSAHDITFDISSDEIEQMKKKTNQATNFLFRTKDLL